MLAVPLVARQVDRCLGINTMSRAHISLVLYMIHMGDVTRISASLEGE